MSATAKRNRFLRVGNQIGSMQRVAYITGLTFLCAAKAYALPIGFGHTQGDTDYDLVETKNFKIYHDADTPNEARGAASALEAARPILEGWMQVKRLLPLPVIMTARSAGASFANNITDAVELQTLGRGDRDLYWHEFIHSTMYRHYDNFLGPAGSVIHLIWMPTWFIEGLPEALSVSSSSSIQAGFERYHALSQKWPEYESLHSLYGVGAFATEGYATSGAFVAYIFRKYGASKLPQLLKDFYDNTQLWWWPWAALPYSPYLPFDDALKNMTGKEGRELYAEYQAAATAYWRDNSRGPFFAGREGRRVRISPRVKIWSRGSSIRYIESDKDDGKAYLKEAVFDKEQGWSKSKRISTFPSDAYVTSLNSADVSVFTREGLYDGPRIKGQSISVLDQDGDLQDLVEIPGSISNIYKTATQIAFVNNDKEVTKLCMFPRSLIKPNKALSKASIRCPIKVQQPKILHVLGSREIRTNKKQGYVTKEIWVATTEQTLKGNRYQVYSWNPEGKRPITAIGKTMTNEPISVAFTKNNIWLHTAERKQSVLRSINRRGECRAIYDVADIVIKAWGLADEALAIQIRSGDTTHLYGVYNFHSKPCRSSTEHISPLLVATRSKGKVSIEDAVQAASLWAEADTTEDGANAIKKAKPLGKEAFTKKGDLKLTKVSPAPWRPRPVSALPWVGADSGGISFGFLSAPLMDHMQNETVMINSLWGYTSRYPSTNIKLTSTRFSPKLDFELFRELSWEGLAIKDGRYFTPYSDESGFRFNLSNYWAFGDLSYSLGLKNSMVRPTKNIIRRGRLNEAGLSLSKGFDLGTWGLSTSLNTEVAPSFMNNSFEYIKYGTAIKFSRSFDFIDSRFSLGLSGSQTQGEKTRNLKESYQPLKTFIPGSGGGANGSSIELLQNPNVSLFSSRFGDTQGRFSLNYSFPLIANFNKLVRIVYVRSLEFSSFFNYGGAWNIHDPVKFDIYGRSLECKSFDCDRFVAAYGANIDWLLDIKGININLSLGAGQVILEPLALFVKFGFDSILEIN